MRLNKIGKTTLFIFIILLIALLFLLRDESNRPIHIDGADTDKTIGRRSNSAIVINENDGVSGELSKTERFALNAGDYSLGIEYWCDSPDNYIEIKSYNEVLFTYCLDPTIGYQTFQFQLDRDYVEIQFFFYYAGSGTMHLLSMELSKAGGFYNDAWFLAILTIFVAIGMALYFFLTRKKIMNFSPVPIVLFGIILLSSLPLLNNRLIWGNDIAYHMVRIEGIKDGLRGGQFPVMIYPEGNNGHGYLNAMYPSFFLYIPAFLRLCGVSIVTSYKFLLILGNIGCVILTYFALCSIQIRTRIALMGTAIYALFPYHFTNFYSRAALGESLAMVFIPIALVGLFHVILGDRQKAWQLVLGMSGLIQTHVLSSVVVVLVCLIVAIVYIVPICREHRLFLILKTIGITILLNLCFIIPFVYYYLFGNLCTESVKWSNFQEYSLYLDTVFGLGITHDYRALSLGFPIGVLMLLTAIFVGKQFRDSRIFHPLYSYTIALFFIGGLFLFMVINQFPSDRFMKISSMKFLLQSIQFPWRFMGIIAAIFIITGTVALSHTNFLKHYEKTITVIMIVMTGMLAVPESTETYPYEDYTATYSEGHFQKVVGIPIGSNTVVYPYEWNTRGLTDEFINNPRIQYDLDIVEINNFARSGTTSSVSYRTSARGQTIVLPLTYYRGYSAKDEQGKDVPLYQSETGEIAFSLLPDGTMHTVTIAYIGTWYFTVGYIVSAISVIAVGVMYILRRRWKGVYGIQLLSE